MITINSNHNINNLNKIYLIISTLILYLILISINQYTKINQHQITPNQIYPKLITPNLIYHNPNHIYHNPNLTYHNLSLNLSKLKKIKSILNNKIKPSKSYIQSKLKEFSNISVIQMGSLLSNLSEESWSEPKNNSKSKTFKIWSHTIIPSNLNYSKINKNKTNSKNLLQINQSKINPFLKNQVKRFNYSANPKTMKILNKISKMISISLTMNNYQTLINKKKKSNSTSKNSKSSKITFKSEKILK